MDSLKELEKLVDEVGSIVGIKYKEDFKNIIGGCHCYPRTEWYGDIFLAFKHVIADNAISDKLLKEKMIFIIKELSMYLSNDGNVDSVI